jgi:glycosyltransferase involved in cell wall biosynthesis
VLVSGGAALHGGDMAYFAEEHGLQPIYVEDLGAALDPVTTVRAIRAMTRLMRDWQPDIVHTHMHQGGFIGRVAAWRAGVPVIVHTFHGHALGGEYGALRTRLFILAERFAARRTDTLIALTQSLRRQLHATYRVARPGAISVLPLGLDLSGFASTPRHQGHFRAARGIAPDAPLIGIVGRLALVKNHALFLQAAARLHARRPDARFVIIGDGELRAEIEAQMVALGLGAVVQFTGWQRDLTPVYSDLDVLVNSSINEGTPTPIIEALAAGCPVVATAVGGVPDLLEHGRLGLLVLPDEADMLADAMELALDNPPEGADARQLMLKRYGIDRLITDLDALYHGLLTMKRRKR